MVSLQMLLGKFHFLSMKKIFILILSICLHLNIFGEVYKQIDSPMVTGEPTGNKAKNFYVRMTSDGTFIRREDNKLTSSSSFSMSPTAYLLDENNNRYSLIDKNTNPNYFSQMFQFEPLPRSCSRFTIVNGSERYIVNLNSARGKRVIHAGSREPSNTLKDIFLDMSDLVSQYYENLGTDENRGIFYTHKLSDLSFSINGTVVTFCSRTNSDQYYSHREMWFDMAEASFCEETAIGTYASEQDKGPQKFIHITCPSGIFIRDIWESELNDHSVHEKQPTTDYYVWTNLPTLSSKFHNGLLWIKAALNNPNIKYTNLSSPPPGVTPRKTDNTSSRQGRNGNTASRNNSSSVFRPQNATIVDGSGSHTYSSYDCPNMTVSDRGSTVTITWGGDTVTLSKIDNSTYSASGRTSRGSVTIRAMRSSRTGKIYLVTAQMPNPTPGVQYITINFKP